MTGHPRIPVVLDCDTGSDDAVAIMLAAHHPALDLLGVTTVWGQSRRPRHHRQHAPGARAHRPRRRRRPPRRRRAGPAAGLRGPAGP
ncbi:nucleoside hydrolase [Nocardioides sp. TF02-7]|uniref:nucleoside hydrolase n=1 Tax=Nocardioides sp. TF02-7 TaxID=2917724 RepID=UPI0023DCCFDE|nr:nucleoside hydrolase [Nocardioides sp. TF02-7]